MSAPGDTATTVDAAALMALGARATRPAGALAERPGIAPTRKRGQGHEIREIRPFTDGDDPRHLDAAATARSGIPQVRSFHEDRERTVLLVADFRRPMLWGTRGRLRSVAAAEALALAGWQAVLGAGAAGVVAITDAGLLAERPRARDAGMARVAGLLARAHALALDARAPVRDARPRPRPRRPLRPARRRHRARHRPRRPRPRARRRPRRPRPPRAAPRLILTEDAFETAPPAAALPFLTADGRVARARFSALPEARAARLAALRLPGLTAERLATACRPRPIVAELHPPRLPAAFIATGWPDLLAAFGLGLLLAALASRCSSPPLLKPRPRRESTAGRLARPQRCPPASACSRQLAPPRRDRHAAARRPPRRALRPRRRPIPPPSMRSSAARKQP